jgi:hypothetical protein
MKVTLKRELKYESSLLELYVNDKISELYIFYIQIGSYQFISYKLINYS